MSPVDTLSPSGLARRRLVALCGLLSAYVSNACASSAYPERPVKLVTSSGPGGVIDVVARVLSDALGKLWNQTVIVDNRVGASGMLASDFVAKSAPDGYTILLTTQTAHIYNPLLRKTPYDPFADFTPISEIVQGAIALASSKSFPPDSAIEMVAAARKSAKALTYGTWGVGSGAHLLGEQMKTQGAIELIHVPYKNAETGIVQDLVGGSLDVGFLSAATATAQAQNGRIKILGVTGTKRSRQLPNVPTFLEQGLSGMDFGGWVAAYGPAKTPADITSKLTADVVRVVSQADVTARLTAMGFDVIGSNGKQLLEANRREFDHWATALKRFNIKLE